MSGASMESRQAWVMATSLPKQCRETYEIMKTMIFPSWNKIKGIVLCGMGGC